MEGKNKNLIFDRGQTGGGGGQLGYSIPNTWVEFG